MRRFSTIIAVLLVIFMLASCTGPVSSNEETTAVKTAEETAATPTETTEAPKVETTEAPATETTGEPAVKTTEAPVIVTEEPEIETTESPVIETTEAPATETTEASATETTEAPATETTETPATETTEISSTETTEEESQSGSSGGSTHYPYPPYIPDDEEETTDGGDRPGADDEECEHSYAYVGSSLLVPGGRCTDGVYVCYECSICGDSWEYTYYNIHVITEEYIDLSEYAVCENHNIRKIECLCGDNRGFNISYLNYSVEIEPEDCECDVLRTYRVCSDCGVSATVEMDLEDVDGCISIYIASVNIDINGEPIYSSDEIEINEAFHDFVIASATLFDGATSCEDGISAILECTDCGDTNQTIYYSHEIIVKEHIDVSGFGVCEEHAPYAYECTCGAIKGISATGLEANVLGSTTIESCDDCGLMVVTEQTAADGDGCIYEATINVTMQISSSRYVDVGAENKYQFADLVKGEDGNYYTSDGNAIYIAIDYPIEWLACDTLKYYVNIYGEAYLSLTYWENLASAMNSLGLVPLNDETYSWHLDLITENPAWQEDESHCCNYWIEYISGEEEEIYSTEYTTTVDTHNFVNRSTSLVEGATTCLQGVIISSVCTECGETRNEQMWGHVEIEELVDLSDYDTCGMHGIVYSECACGEVKQIGVVGGFWADWDASLQKYVKRCDSCDFVMYYAYEYEEKDENCWTYQQMPFEFYFGESLIDTYVSRERMRIHQLERSYELLPGSEKCTDGVTVVETCTDCGEEMDSYVIYDHEIVANDELDLSEVRSEYGVCESHNIVLTGCACGMIKNHYTENVSNDYVNWDYEKDVPYCECSDCGLRIYVYDNTGEGFYDEDREVDISYSRYECYVYTGEELVHVGNFYSTHEVSHEHDYAWNFEFLGEEEDCEGGVVYTIVCTVCGSADDENTRHELYDHQYVFRTIDLTEYGVCESHTPQLGICPCGREHLFYVAEMDREEISDTVFVDSCAECGLTITHEYGEKTPKDEECTYQQWITATFTIGETEIEQIEYKQTFPNRHRTVSTVRLIYTNASSCESGIIYHAECKDCDYTYDSDPNSQLNFHLNGYSRYDIEGGCDDHEFLVGACACKQEFETSFIGFKVEDEEDASWHGCSHCDVYVVESVETVDEETYTYTRFYIGEEKIIGFVAHNNEVTIEEE